jgi:aminopeptidase N
VRDVHVVVGRFRVVRGLSAGVQVTVAVEGGVRDDPSSYLTPVVRAIDDLSRRFGPYPWPAYTLVVTPVLAGGIEYPMLVSQGPGTQGRTTPHEVGHQWFYGLVGNNQGRDPWLDEGLATWAEVRVLGTLSALVARPIPADARGRTGEPMTFWNGRSSYFRGVYVQGAQALAALGSPDAVDCGLRIFVARNAHRVARVDDLVRSLETVFPDARAVLGRFGVRY